MLKSARSWVEISKPALVHNVEVFRKTVGSKVKIMVVVKSNAYGHGVKETVQVLSEIKDVDWFGVDSIDEAVGLRRLGINKPVLVLGYTPVFRVEDACRNSISIAVYNSETLNALSRLKTKINIHLKIDSGMGRQGVKVSEVEKIVDFIRSSRNINLEGVFTHFASADEEDFSFTDFQIKNFKKTLQIIKSKGIIPEIVHCSATAGTMANKRGHFNLVRAGIGLYGLYPSGHVEKISTGKFRPVLSWKCYIARIKMVSKGESVGYGRTWIADGTRKIALIPVGYYDGYDRKLSNKGRVIIKGKYAPVVGRVSMNMMSVDVTNIKDFKLEDEVILLGKEGRAEVSADWLAREIGTINYEVVTRINSVLPRFIV